MEHNTVPQLPRSILKSSKSANDDADDTLTYELCEEHQYLGDKYKLSKTCLQVRCAPLFSTLTVHITAPSKPKSVRTSIAKLLGVHGADDSAKVNPPLIQYCPACDSTFHFKGFHNAREILREAVEAAFTADVEQEEGKNPVRQPDLFTEDAVKKYNFHLRGLNKARVRWQLLFGPVEPDLLPTTTTATLPSNAASTGKSTKKVHFGLSPSHREPNPTRARGCFRRGTMLYLPGRWACTDEEGYWDTSSAYDRYFLYEVEVQALAERVRARQAESKKEVVEVSKAVETISLK